MDDQLRNIERRVLNGEADLLPEYVSLQERVGKSQILFIVVSESFDYNDEYFFSVEGADPVIAFLDKEKAELEATILTTEWLRQNCTELQEWNGNEGWPGLFDIESGVEMFLTGNGVTDMTEDGFNTEQCSYEQLRTICEKLSIGLYNVRQIVLADGLCMATQLCEQPIELLASDFDYLFLQFFQTHNRGIISNNPGMLESCIPRMRRHYYPASRPPL